MSTRLVKQRHVTKLIEIFEEKAREQEGAALKLRDESQWELEALASVRAEVYRDCAKRAREVEEYAHER